MAKKISKVGYLAYLSTMFLGAFNDNVSKMVVILFVSSEYGKNEHFVSTFVAVVGACFIFPYLLFSAIAGYMSDRFPKQRVMFWSKVAEVVVMVLGFWAIVEKYVYALPVVMFLMGVQSAFFSPAKYGFLPEISQDDADLAKVNGQTQMLTFLAIVFGGWFGGEICSFYSDMYYFAFLTCVVIAVIGVVASCLIPLQNFVPNKMKFEQYDPISPHVRTLKDMMKNDCVWRCVLICTSFWFLGAAVQSAMILLVKGLNGSDRAVGIAQALLGLGIGIGSMITGYLCRKKLALNLVRPAGIALGLVLMIIGCGIINLACVCVLIAVIGFFAGIYQLPASIAIQQFSPRHLLGRYLGACNALDSVSMLAGTGLFMLMGQLRLPASSVFLALGIMVMIFAPAITYRQFDQK